MHNLEEVIDKLISIERSKYDALLKILDLTKSQHNAILDANIDELKEFIELRQKEIDSLEVLDKEYSMIIEKVKIEYKVEKLEDIEVFNDSKAYELEKIVDRIKKTMKEVNSYEEDNHRILEEQTKEFKSKLKQINQGKRAEKLYQTKGYVQPVFYDKKTHY